MNESTAEEKTKTFLQNFREQEFKSIQASMLLFRLDDFYTGFSAIFHFYIQPFIVIFSTIFLLVVLVVLFRKKLISIFEGILLLANFLEISTRLLAVPIKFIFVFFSDTSIPMSFPACSIYYNLHAVYRVALHVTAQYLNLLMAINRVVAVYRPSKLNIWFSKKLTIVFCSLIIIAGVLVGVGSNVLFPKMKVKKWVDDVWQTGNFEVYSVCSMEDVLRYSASQVYLQLTVLTFAILPTVTMLILNVAVIKRLRNIQQPQEASSQTSPVDQRTYSSNKPAIAIMMTLFVLELPMLASKIHSWIMILRIHLEIVGAESYEESISRILNLIYECVFPIDLLLYVLLSKKLRRAIQDCFSGVFVCCKR